MVIKNISVVILIIIQIISQISSELNPDNVVAAINCGGESFTDSKGIAYEKDNYFTGGQSSDFGANFEIKLTNDQELYQTERWASEDFFYDIPITQQGKFVLVLKFSEVYFNSTSEKIFDISLGNENVIRHLDIYSRVGKATAFDEFVQFELKNNKIYVNVI